MTVSNTNTNDRFTTNGVTVAFTYTFYATDTNQIFASTIDSDGNETAYTDFTVVLAGDNNGGTFTTGTALNDVDLFIYRDTPQTQETDYVKGGRFPAESHEAALDKLTLQSQEQQTEIDRTLKFSEGANTFDAGGRKIINVGDATESSDAVNLGVMQNYTYDKSTIDAKDTAIQDKLSAQIGYNSIGEYTTNPTFNGYNEFTYLAGSENQYKVKDATIALPYTVDSATYPNPASDPSLTPFADINTTTLPTLTDLVFATVQDLTDGIPVALQPNQVCRILERGNALWLGVAGGSADNYTELDAGGGNTALWQPSADVLAREVGVSTGLVTNDGAVKSLISKLKLGGVSSVTFDSGVFNFQCFDGLTRGRAAFETRDISNVQFIGGVGTIFKAVVGGLGTDPFAICRIDENTKNFTFNGIEFDGDYSNVPEFQGQIANRSAGIIIAQWNFSDSGQASYTDYSVDGIQVHGCRFTNVGGGVITQRKSLNTTDPSRFFAKITNNVFTDSAQANNACGFDNADMVITDNRFKTTLPLSDTIWTLAVDASRGSERTEIARNNIDTFHFGIKAEYQLNGGVGADELKLADLIEIHHNKLINIGHPTIDSIGGPSGSGSYGIRISGDNCIEYENQVTGLNNPAAAIHERMVFGIWANQTGVAGTNQKSRGGLVSTAQTAVNHNSADARNQYSCKYKKIRDCLNGFILQAGGRATENNIKRIGNLAIELQIADQTAVHKNFIQESDQNGTAGAAIKQTQNASDAAYRYWEVTDNEIIDVNSGAGDGFTSIGGTDYSKPYKYTEGRCVTVASCSTAEYVNVLIESTPVKAKGLGNPSSNAIIASTNVANLSNVDANTFQINFKRAMPSTSFTWDAREPNNPGVFWVGWGSTVNYLRLRSVDSSGSPVALPSTVMFTVN